MSQYYSQQAVAETALYFRSKQFRTTRFQQLAVFNARWADGLARSTAKATIDVDSECRRLRREFALLDGAHQVDSSAGAIILVPCENVRRTSFEAQPAMHAGEQLLFFGCEG
jgi:hypothetical protein